MRYKMSPNILGNPLIWTSEIRTPQYIHVRQLLLSLVYTMLVYFLTPEMRIDTPI